MTDRKFEINSLRVASPCPMNWENMSGDELTRFCDLCSLNVYNISEMSEREVQTLVAKSEGRICARIYKRADGTVLTRNCPVGFRAYQKRVSRFAGAALATIMGICSIAFGQSDSKKEKVCKQIPQGKITREETKIELSFLKGTITDETGAVVPGATIKLVNEATKKEFSVSSDEDGEYKFPNFAAGLFTIEFSASGFTKYVIQSLKIEKNEAVELEIVLQTAEGTVTIGILGSEPLLDANSNSHTRRFDSKLIQKLPF